MASFHSLLFTFIRSSKNRAMTQARLMNAMTKATIHYCLTFVDLPRLRIRAMTHPESQDLLAKRTKEFRERPPYSA
jgi:hypothetical protein